MKKYPISKFNFGIYVACLSLCLPLLIVAMFGVRQALEEQWSISDLLAPVFMLSISGVGVLLYLYIIFIDYGTGKFTLDAEGITMRIGFKTSNIAWADCVEFDLIGISVESVGAANAANAYWFYCSKRHLTYDEKRKFLRKTRYQLDTVHFFQYSKEPFELMLTYIPPDKAQYLREKFDRINMNKLEKLYNK